MSLTFERKHRPLQRLENDIPRGGPLDTGALHSAGISTALAWKYVNSGWLRKLGRGLFMFPNDRFDRDTCLKFLATKIPGLHVAGKTALAWRGILHNIPFQETIHLLGDVSVKLPGWFTERFPATYATRRLFDNSLPADFALKPLPDKPDGPLVSVRERALLEMLSEVGLSQDVEEARNIMEGLFTVRDEVLATLLRACDRAKVVRLCIQWAEELGLPWAPAMRAAMTGSIGTRPWSSRMRNGKTLTLRPE